VCANDGQARNYDLLNYFTNYIDVINDNFRHDYNDLINPNCEKVPSFFF